MGSLQSHISPEVSLTAAVVLAGALVLGYTQHTNASTIPSSTGKKKKKATPPAKDNTTTVMTPSVPGGFPPPIASSASLIDTENVAAKPKRGKKKASKSTASLLGSAAADRDYHSETSTGQPESNKHHSSKTKRPSSSFAPVSDSSPGQLTKPLLQSSASISMETDGSWTRVEPQSRRRPQQQQQKATDNIHRKLPSSGDPSTELSTSSAGVMTSATGSGSSPRAERTDDDESASQDSNADEKSNRSLLAGNARGKPSIDSSRLETPDISSDASRNHALRVHRPRADEKPATGFSWADYEDVRLEESTGGGNDADADGEDDGWGVVKSRGRSKFRRPTSQSQSQLQHHYTKAPETLTQKQRQNASKREALKAQRAEGEVQRLATLAKHRAEGAAAAKGVEQERRKETTGGKR